MNLPVLADVPEIHAPALIDAAWRDIEHHGRRFPVPLPPLDADVDKVWVVLSPPKLDARTERTH